MTLNFLYIFTGNASFSSYDAVCSQTTSQLINLSLTANAIIYTRESFITHMKRSSS